MPDPLIDNATVPRYVSRLWYPGLLLATAIVAVALVDVNLRAWYVINYDPQGFEQDWIAYLAAAGFAYTSGAIVGQTSALVAGLVIARNTARPSRIGLGWAILAGLGLWLAASLAAFPFANAGLREALTVLELADTDVADANLLTEPRILAIVALNTAGYLLAACLGFGLGVRSGPRARSPLVRSLGWIAYAVLLTCILLSVAGLGGMFTAPTVPSVVSSLVIYLVVTVAYVLVARPGLHLAQAVAPLPLLLAFTPVTAIAPLPTDPYAHNDFLVLALPIVAALAVWAIEASWSAALGRAYAANLR